MTSVRTGLRWAAVVCLLLLACGLAASEEGKAPPPRSILDHAHELGLTDDQQSKIRTIIGDHETALESSRDKVLLASREIDELVAQEADLEAIRAKLQEEEDLRGEARLGASMASREIAGLLTDPQRLGWKAIRRTEGLDGSGPTWPSDDDVEARPPRSAASTGPIGYPFLGERPFQLTDQQIESIRTLQRDLARTLRVIQAKLIILAFELDEPPPEGDGDEASIKEWTAEEARLRVEARFKDIETSRLVNAVLTKEQLAAWKEYQARARGEVATLRPGVWKWSPPGTILGRRSESSIRVSRDGTGLAIEFMAVSIPGVNERGRRARSHTGPFALHVEGPIARWRDGEADVESTWRLDGDSLLLPAVARADERTWEFRSPRARGVFRCASDPFQEPEGAAEFPAPASEGQARRYSMQERPDPRRAGETIRKLRFSVIMPSGEAHEECRLIWDEYGSPRFDGSSWYHDFAEIRYEPIDEQEWRADLGLPDLDGK